MAYYDIRMSRHYRPILIFNVLCAVFFLFPYLWKWIQCEHLSDKLPLAQILSAENFNLIAYVDLEKRFGTS